MSLYATLGDTELDLITWLDGLDFKYAATYAEQGLIGRKSLLQHTGYAPDELSIRATLHAQWCNPATEAAKLKDHLDAARPLSLVMGSGEYRGVFIIKDLALTTRQTDGDGAAIAFEISCTLQEYIGDPAAPNPPGVITEGWDITASNEAMAAAVTDPIDAILAGTPIGEVAATVSEAVSAIGNIAAMAQDVASLAQAAINDPLSAVSMITGISMDLQGAASLLPVDALAAIDGGMQAASSLMEAAGEIDSAVQAISADPLSGIRGAVGNMGNAMTAIDASRQGIAQLASASLLRQA